MILCYFILCFCFEKICLPNWVLCSFSYLWKLPGYSHHLGICGWITFHSVTQDGEKKICLFTSCRRAHDNGAGDKLVGTIQHSGIVLLRCMEASHLTQRCPQTDLIFSSARASTFTLSAGWDASILENSFSFVFSFFSWVTAIGMKTVAGWICLILWWLCCQGEILI